MTARVDRRPRVAEPVVIYSWTRERIQRGSRRRRSWSTNAARSWPVPTPHGSLCAIERTVEDPRTARLEPPARTTERESGARVTVMCRPLSRALPPETVAHFSIMSACSPEDQVVRYCARAATTSRGRRSGSGPPVVIGGWWSSHLVHDWASSEYRLRRPTRRASDGDRYDARARAVTANRLRINQHRGSARSHRRCDRGRRRAPASACSAAHPEPCRVDLRRRACGIGRSAHPVWRVPSRLRTRLAFRSGGDGGAVRRNWGISSRVLTDIFLPDATASQRDDVARLQRRVAGADQAASALASMYGLDAAAWAGRVTAATLVLHRRGDRAIRFGLGRESPKHSGCDLPAARRLGAFPVVRRCRRGGRPHAALSRRRSPGCSGGGRNRAGADGIALLTAPRTRDHGSDRGRPDRRADRARLHVSPHTVHRHVANVRTKLGVGSRAAAAARIAAVGE